MATKRALPFTVVIPIPYRDKAGRSLAPALRELWEVKAVSLLTDCFGGATPIDSPGYYRMAGGLVSLEVGQRAVISVSTRARFKEHRAAIESFAGELMDALDQEAVCVMAFPGGESFLLA